MENTTGYHTVIEKRIGPPIRPKIKAKGSNIRHNTREIIPQSQSLATLNDKGIEANEPRAKPKRTPIPKNIKDKAIKTGISNIKQKI